MVEQGIDLEISDGTLSNDLKVLLRSGDSADVTITCEGEEFKAHTQIICARSPVFAGMFKHDTMEKENRRIEIVDIKKEVVREMLTFIYTDETSKLDEMVDGLLAAAEKYDIRGLRYICKRSLSTDLCIENAAETLLFADKHCAYKLKKRASEFIVSHRADVIKTAAWKYILEEHVVLAYEAFELISEKAAHSMKNEKMKNRNASFFRS